MELTLYRTYDPEGVNGRLCRGEELICHTIELPWRANSKQLSCIPEGRYRLNRRHSARYQWHIEVEAVPGRSEILIRPDSGLLPELLRGCIAPVSSLTGTGKGSRSRAACDKLKTLVYAAIAAGKDVYLHIVKDGR